MRISRLDTGEGRISELEDILIESWQTQKKENKDQGEKTEQNIQDYGAITTGVTKA